jgi:23S rRNA (guanosine2251-2'-O)-methyltransferase
MADRLPFLAAAASAPYAGLKGIPVSVLLDNVRSMYNVGAFFRTMDAAGCEKLYLCGITARPPERGITKTALGAEDSVPWRYCDDAASVAAELHARECELAAVETSDRAIDLYDWKPRFPVCLMFGHEVDGLRRELLDACDAHVRIPMLGRKHSLNVATAGGIVIFELLRKYRRMIENTRKV